MIEIGNKAKVVMGSGSTYILSSLVDFYDLIGKNVLYIYSDNDTALKCNCIKSSTRFTWEMVKEKIMSNLFRLDIIIVAPNIYYDKISELIDKEIKLPTIYLTSSNVVVDDPHRLDPYDYGYLFFKKEQQLVFATLRRMNIEDYEKEYFIKDLKNDWVDSVVNLKTTWIRDKKIDDLLK